MTKEGEKDRLRKLYADAYPYLKEAESWLHRLLKEIIANIEDKTLVRARLQDVRIKDFERLERKAREKCWGPEEAITSASDLVGGRVVCNNLEDIRRFAELLRELLPVDSTIEQQDYLHNPRESGYRALHINFRVWMGQPLPTVTVPCEVQIRTLLQDSWAELAHDDIYKPAADLPFDLKARMRDLGQILSVADGIASDIRARVAEEVSPSDANADLTKISSDGAARIFAIVFGKNPPEYVVRAFLNACEEAGISSLTEAQTLLSDSEFRNKLNSEYQQILGVPMSAEEIFRLIPAAVREGPERAISEARKLARKEKQGAEQFWRKEVLADMPETLGEFKEELSVGTLPVGQIADALGAVGECAICGEQLINPNSFEHAVVDFYEEDEVDGTIEAEVINSGHPVTDEELPNLCTYHAHVVSKDD